MKTLGLRHKNNTEYRGLARINLQLFADTSGKTEKATPKKREELRKKGQVMQSREVTSNLILLMIFLSFKLVGNYLYAEFKTLFNLFLTDTAAYNLADPNEIMRLATFAALQIAKMVAPFLIIALVFGILGSYFQIGFLFTLEPIRPKFSHINPINGLKRIFSSRSLFELVKSITKVIIVAWVAWSSIQGEFLNLTKLMALDLGQIVLYTLGSSVDIGIKICLALLAVSAADYFFQWRKYEKDIRMTKQEVKEEYKQLEGNPEIRSRIRQKQREISMRRMLSEVPKADVVITNPTHFAVAIRYEPQKKPAPYVVAKGADYLAERIKEIARKSRVEIVENKPLAQALYQSVDIGDVIPPELYRAVAEVLAFVYNLQGKNPQAAL
ncbi:MAG: flagellar biosynthesis protein FlhB [Clostridiaceae bacterium]|nr:flagellar biosynthesis protein FlhB [Clostridiaceae bacterium]